MQETNYLMQKLKNIIEVDAETQKYNSHFNLNHKTKNMRGLMKLQN